MDLLVKAAEAWLGVADLGTTNEADSDGCTSDGRQDEAVGAIPGRSPATAGSGGVGPVEGDEGGELGDQGEFDGHEEGGPSDGGREHA